MAETRSRFFTRSGTEVDEHGRVVVPPANKPRTLTAAAARLNLDRTNGMQRIDKRVTSAWQTEAWRFFDAIGELHFSFETIGNILSRIRIFAAIIEDPDAAPIPVGEYLARIEESSGQMADSTRRVLNTAEKLVNDLVSESEGGSGGLMRGLAINFGVAGEAYLVRHDGKWIVASCDELTTTGDQMRLRRDRSSKQGDIPLSKDCFIARLWRQHPRRGNEPDSSMLGVLDVCSTLVLLEQSVRVMTRSRLNAGIVFIPEGLTPVGGMGEEETIESVIIAAATTSAEDEGAAVTVVPIVVTGPAEQGKELKRIELGRQVDQVTLDLIEATMGRLMAGIDIPRDTVEGMSGVRYSNAIVIHDDLYRSHIDPLALLIVDSLTDIYLRPSLNAVELTRRELPNQGRTEESRFAQHAESNGNGSHKPEPGSDILDRLVVWFDPSAVIIRPDKSQAANEGWDRHLLSGDAWRQARGFNEGDAPSDEELRRRIAIEKAPVPPDMASVILEAIDPEFFSSQREAAQEATQMPGEVSQLLAGQTEAPGQSMEQAAGGGELVPGGNMPPPPGGP